MTLPPPVPLSSEPRPVITSAPTFSALAECYDVTQPALVKMARKYGLKQTDLVFPDLVYERLLAFGDRRGALVRRLSSPDTQDQIIRRILECEFYEL